MKIQIKEPCHENWDKMKIGLISRHCDSCKKDVFDFTQKSREEIIIHLLSNPNENVCGRMQTDQFDFHHDDIPILIEALKHRPSNSSFLILTLVCLSLVACGSDNTSIKPKQDVDPKEQIMGDIVMPIDTNNVKSTPNALGKISRKDLKVEECITTKGEVMLGEPIIQGGISPDPFEVNPIVGGKISIDSVETKSPLKFADKMPEYPGGLSALYKFIEVNTKYPTQERNDGIQGTVYVKIIVNKDGSISNPTILKSIAGHPNFDEEVLRVIQLMPNWVSGENNGQKVDVEYTLPFRFKIPD